MKSLAATMTSKGQVTVPVELRRVLGLRPGDKLVFAQDAAGKIYIEAHTDTMADLRGIVRRPAGLSPEPVDSDRIAGWIEESRIDRWRRTRDEEA